MEKFGLAGDFVFVYELICHILLFFLILLGNVIPLFVDFLGNHSLRESFSVLLFEFGSNGFNIFSFIEKLCAMRLFGGF